jgi:hypothetical protein
VLVGVVAVVDAVDVVAGDELLEEELLVSGDGETIATVDVELDEEVAEVEADAVVVEDAGFFWVAGLELSFGTPPANGSRTMRASTTLTGSAAGVVAVVVVAALVVVAAGGAGTVGVVLADAPLSRNTGTATTAMTRIATIIHSLRSTRSRRSELIPVLRWSCRPSWPTGRWWR